MMRLLMLPLFLFTLSMACMGQTFQYSRGWTNGKRSLSPPGMLSHYRRGDDNFAEVYDFPDTEHKLERCLVQLQRFVGNAVLHHPYVNALSYNSPSKADSSSLNVRGGGGGGINNNNDNNLYHHQSSEFLEELNAAAAAAAAAVATSSGGGNSGEPSEFSKH